MAGHSKWANIKHRKEAADQKRGHAFAKLLNAISVAAKTDPNPDFNPRLRAAVEKAKEANVPKEKIEAAIRRASDSAFGPEELVFEAYGPGGAAMMIEAISDSRNRTIAEIKKLLSDFGGKLAEPKSVSWGFEKTIDGWRAKFPQELNEEGKNNLRALVKALESREDVQKVYTNTILM